MTIEERFLDKVFKSKDGHWWWIGTLKNRRQGSFSINGKSEIASRVSMHLFRGFDLNSEDQINHKIECNKSLCVNPDHLYEGSQRENVKDEVKVGTHNMASKTHCIDGHEFTPENTYMYHGGRYCKKCKQRRSEEFQQRKVQLLNNTEVGRV